MASSAGRKRGFTLFEVLAAVAVLAWTFTLLAKVAIVGLHSEGADRRRAEAALVADRELSALETALDAGVPPEVGVIEKQEDRYRIAIEVLPEDVLSLLPAQLEREIADDTDGALASLLVDDRGESRVHRLHVVVEWDEVEAPGRVERITHRFDTSELGSLFPTDFEPGDTEEGDDDDEPSAEDRSLDERLRSGESLESLLRDVP